MSVCIDTVCLHQSVALSLPLGRSLSLSLSVHVSQCYHLNAWSVPVIVPLMCLQVAVHVTVTPPIASRNHLLHQLKLPQYEYYSAIHHYLTLYY